MKYYLFTREKLINFTTLLINKLIKTIFVKYTNKKLKININKTYLSIFSSSFP